MRYRYKKILLFKFLINKEIQQIVMLSKDFYLSYKANGFIKESIAMKEI